MSMNLKLFSYVLACLIVMLMPRSSQAQDTRPADPVVVAKYGETVITQDELIKYAGRDLDRLEQERAQREMKYARDRNQILQVYLARLLEDKLLQAEAARRGVGKEQLLATELQGKLKEPTDEDVKTFYEANKQRISKPLMEIDAQIRNYLKTQNYENAKAALVEKLRQSYGVTIALQPFRSEVETEGFPSEGPASAAVTLVEFSDFQCPYCANLQSTLRQVLDKYGPKVRLVYRNFPLSQIHPNAEKAAEAGLCAADQGHFWEMHDLMFQSQGQLKADQLKEKAAQLKLNAEAFNSCLDSGQKAGKVQQDINAVTGLGVTGAPALFVNGRLVAGAVPFAEIAQIIDEELTFASQSAKQTDSPHK